MNSVAPHGKKKEYSLLDEKVLLNSSLHKSWTEASGSHMCKLYAQTSIGNENIEEFWVGCKHSVMALCIKLGESL
jgi:hypothetical protein